MATSSVCGCFGNLRPRYKRLVDNIFPSDPSQGLVKSNMEKLTFYALQAPEKLDRIGDYMFMKINNHLYRKRIGFVYIAMEAMDSLLLACRSSSLNLFVESFLKMVSTLLESSEPGLQICATNSFVKFANIDEDTPSYHRRYEFFISRFSQLCYGSNDKSETEKKIRLSGLQGLQGVVRKTVNDDLQANIWDDVHMSKIVPALLFNIESNAETLLCKSSASVAVQVESPEHQDDDPAHLADLCLRELVTRAGFNNIPSILYPLLTFMDTRSLWLKNDFPLHIFKIIMYSIQNQYSYRAIELLLSHLDKHKNSEAEMRASVIEMISASVGIATGGSVGPSILEVFNTLLKHMKMSVDFASSAENADGTASSKSGKSELLVQKAIITAAGAFSSILADYQRADVMLFIIMKIPYLNATDGKKQTSSTTTEADDEIGCPMTLSPEKKAEVVSLLKCVLKVAESHKGKQTSAFSSTFSSKLMDAVMTGLLINIPDVSYYVQKLMISLLDRHKNLPALENLCVYSTTAELNFEIEKVTRADSSFIKKNSQYFYFHLYQSCHLRTNDRSNIKLLMNIICLLLLEFNEEETMVQMVGFVLGIQNHARSKDCKLLPMQQSCLHSLTLVFFLLVSDLTAIPAILRHCEEVIAKRHDQAKWLLPSIAFGEDELVVDADKLSSLDESFFFDQKTIVNGLKVNNYETNSIETPYEPKPAVRTQSAVSLPEHFPIVKADSQLSVGSSLCRFEAPVPKITYEDLKDALRGDKVEREEPVINFSESSFKELVLYNERKNAELESKVKKSLDIACRTSQVARHPELNKDLFEMDFPALFVY